MNNTAVITGMTPLFMEDINIVDFAMVKQKLQDEEEGLGWTPTQCDEAEAEYKRFLALKRTYPGKEVVPNKIVDQFWHQHILDTQKYADDCENLFGMFVHHFPYFGMKDEQDRQNLADAFEETRELYFVHFETPFDGEVSRCRTQCKPVKCR